MQIKISNEYLEKDNGDLRLFQPKYHFGQLLINRKCRSGIVVDMGCDSEWHYRFLELQTHELFGRYAEDELVTASDENTEEDIILSPMSIKISNKHLENHNLKLRFTQPKYYFGQLLKDKQGLCGFVIQVSFNGEWEYELTELTTEFPPLFVVRPEHELVTVDLSRVEVKLLTQK